MFRVTGVVQHYAWGDPVAIPGLLGLEPDGRPWAELWLGTHSGGSATLDDGRPLSDVAGELPYLLKVLAAGESLSLQTHPDSTRAREGFEREQRDGPPLHAPERIYKDPSPKPELICALTPFEALCGFRPVEATLLLLDRIGTTEIAGHLDEHGLTVTVTDLYQGKIAIESTIAACSGRGEPEAMLVAALAAQYPGDPSVVVTLLMNRVSLAPGEAIFFGPGNLHAYLHGVGVEVMGASDNVVRGGLTSKHVDVDELLAVLDIAPLTDPVLRGEPCAEGWVCYATSATPFRLWRLDAGDDAHHTATGRELLLCTSGRFGPLSVGQAVYLAPGESISLAGRGTLFRVEERAD
jgi:mannose-6-phosphate isomerase